MHVPELVGDGARPLAREGPKVSVGDPEEDEAERQAQDETNGFSPAKPQVCPGSALAEPDRDEHGSGSNPQHDRLAIAGESRRLALLAHALDERRIRAPDVEGNREDGDNDEQVVPYRVRAHYSIILE